MSRFHEMIEDTKCLTQYYLNNENKRPEFMLVKQLKAIVTELETMDKIRNYKAFYPYYPRGIADSWGYNNELSIKLMEVLELYMKL